MYDRPLTEINVMAILLRVEFADKILIFAVLKRRRETEASFWFYNINDKP